MRHSVFINYLFTLSVILVSCHSTKKPLSVEIEAEKTINTVEVQLADSSEHFIQTDGDVILNDSVFFEIKHSGPDQHSTDSIKAAKNALKKK